MGHIRQSIEVNAPVERCYQVWTDFERFPRFMKHVAAVCPTRKPNVWHWTAIGPLKQTMDWEMEVDSMEFNKAVSWHSVGHSPIYYTNTVHFTALPDGKTEVTAFITYEPPAGRIGEFITEHFQHPEKQVTEDLNHFKQLVEEEERVAHSRDLTRKRDLPSLEESRREYGSVIAPDELPGSI